MLTIVRLIAACLGVFTVTATHAEPATVTPDPRLEAASLPELENSMRQTEEESAKSFYTSHSLIVTDGRKRVIGFKQDGDLKVLKIESSAMLGYAPYYSVSLDIYCGPQGRMVSVGISDEVPFPPMNVDRYVIKVLVGAVEKTIESKGAWAKEGNFAFVSHEDPKETAIEPLVRSMLSPENKSMKFINPADSGFYEMNLGEGSRKPIEMFHTACFAQS